MEPQHEWEGQFAFWRIAEFPYVTGGPVCTHLGGDLILSADGEWHRPTRVMPFDEGEALYNAIETLRRNRSTAIAHLDSGYEDTLQGLLEHYWKDEIIFPLRKEKWKSSGM